MYAWCIKKKIRAEGFTVRLSLSFPILLSRGNHWYQFVVYPSGDSPYMHRNAINKQKKKEINSYPYHKDEYRFRDKETEAQGKVRTTRYLKNLGRSQSLVSKFTFLKIAEQHKELLFMWIISTDSFHVRN